MIVKNEASSIVGTIQSVKGSVDRYCILDTGSTDNTVSLIQSAFGTTPGRVGSFASSYRRLFRSRLLTLQRRETAFLSLPATNASTL